MSFARKGGKRGNDRGVAREDGDAVEWAGPRGGKGASVEYPQKERRVDAKGQARGGRPDFPRPREDRENGPYLGILTRVNEQGYAFIESPICKQWYKQDVYVFPRVMDENNLSEGNAVGFYVHENDKGQPAVDAFKPIWKLLMEPKEGIVPPLGKYAGGILNMTPRGHAYIYCPEIKHKYSKDVYVNEKVVESNSLEEGQYVCFDLHINKSGMPQASSPLWLETNKKNWQRPNNYGKRHERDEVCEEGMGDENKRIKFD